MKQLSAQSKGEEVPAKAETHAGETSTGTLRLWRLSDEERKKRGRKFLLICLCIAPLCVVFPPHIPWPFVAVFVGIVGSIIRSRRAEMVLGGNVTCPHCNAAQTLEAANAEFPLAHFCTKCQERLLVRPEAK